MPLVPAVVLMMLGIGLAEWLQPKSLWWLALPAGALCVAAMVAVVTRQRHWGVIYGWLALLWIGATVHFVQQAPLSDALGEAAARDFQPLVFRAEIVGGAIWSPNSAFRAGDPLGQRWRTQWKVRCYQVRDGALWREVDCRSTLSVVGRIDDLWPGDRVLVFGNCARVSAPSNPGQNDLRPIFRSERQFVFLRADSADQIERIDSSWRRPLARCLAYATYRIDRALHTHVPLGQGALAAALVFGQRQQVDWYAQQQLLTTGTLHMLAISGMHIELVAGALWLVCLIGGVPLRWTLLLVATVVVLYGLIAGANPPVLRAVFMVLAVCAARWRGRRRGLANLLAFSGLAVLAIRTTWIANVGVQLSFLAVATIAIFASRGSRGNGRRLETQQTERRAALASVLEESWSWRSDWS